MLKTTDTGHKTFTHLTDSSAERLRFEEDSIPNLTQAGVGSENPGIEAEQITVAGGN